LKGVNVKMAEQMRAGYLHGKEDVQIDIVDKPVAGKGEVVLKTASAAFCGNDLRSIMGIKNQNFPYLLFHEYSGVVDSVGEGVENYKPGDRISVSCSVGCGKCYYCSIGLDNCCENGRFFAYGSSEYSLFPEEAIRRGALVKLPDNVSLEEGALIEPMACALNGVRKAGVKMGDTVLVVGAGTMGMLNIELCILAGAAKVIVSDLADDRRQRALDWGASRVVDPSKEDLAAVIDEETNGQGCDVTILCIGATSLVNELFKLTKKGGMCYLFAGFSGDTNTTIDVNLIHYKEIFVSGNSGSSMIDYLICLDLIDGGKFDLAKYITHSFPLEQFADAYKAFVDGIGLKVGIEFFKG